MSPMGSSKICRFSFLRKKRAIKYPPPMILTNHTMKEEGKSIEERGEYQTGLVKERAEVVTPAQKMEDRMKKKGYLLQGLE